MTYDVLFTPQARRQLDKLPAQVRPILRAAIDTLRDDPCPHGVEKLSGGTNEYRIREGDYRVLYEIRDKVLVVVVIKVGHRREVYR